MLFRSYRTIGFLTVHRRTEYQAENAGSLVIYCRHRHFTIFQHLEIRVSKVIIVIGKYTLGRQTVGVRTHFNIQTVDGSFIGVVGTAPVGNDTAVELPVIFQNLVQCEIVMAGVLAANLIVSAHNAPGTSFFYRSLECRQIDFMQSTVAKIHINMSAPQFLVVQRIVLDTSCHSVLLQLLDVRYAHHTGQIRVLAHIFKITTVHRSTVDVDAGAQQHILFTIARFLTDGLAILCRHVRIPGSGQTSQSRESGNAVIGPVGISPVIPVDFGTDTVRAVAHPKLGNAEPRNTRTAEFTLRMAKGYLLFQRHPAEGILYTCFNRLRIVHIDRCLCRHGTDGACKK